LKTLASSQIPTRILFTPGFTPAACFSFAFPHQVNLLADGSPGETHLQEHYFYSAAIFAGYRSKDRTFDLLQVRRRLSESSVDELAAEEACEHWG
jgi:hypothetical protein